tara:strand:+ start:45352 stop:46512 length:1161 start_codon:yes stop_codon:yes gene_type:complete
MEVVAVETKKQINAFHKLPFDIYAHDKNWIPHIKQDIEKLFDPKKNPLLKTGKAKRWLLTKNGKVIGRIAAFVNPKYSKQFKHNTGGLGFFECINDYDAAKLLFDTAINWLKEHDMEVADGPINFGEKNMFWGLLVENFTDPNSYGMNYNPPYYQDFFEKYGFNVYYKQFMYKRAVKEPVQEIFARKAQNIINNPEFHFSDVKKMSVDEIAQNFLTVYNSAWGGFAGFKPMDIRTAKNIIKSLKPIMDKRIVLFGFHNKKPIAFYVNIPELNEWFKYVNGNMNIIGKLKFIFAKMLVKPHTMVGIVFGVDREYHGKGVEGALIKFAEQTIAKKTEYDTALMTWVGDFNPKMLHLMENLGAKCYRTYHTYRFMINPDIPFERYPIVQ